MTTTNNLPYTLSSGVEMNMLHPDTFWIPSPEDKANLRPGDLVKLIFIPTEIGEDGCGGERMWVKVTGIDGTNLTGTLDNNPFFIEDLAADDVVQFTPDHIISIDFYCDCPDCEEVERARMKASLRVVGDPDSITLVRVPKPVQDCTPPIRMYPPRGKYDYATPDGRWFIESNWWCGGRWKVIDTHRPEDAQDYNVVQNLAQAKAVIADRLANPH